MNTVHEMCTTCGKKLALDERLVEFKENAMYVTCIHCHSDVLYQEDITCDVHGCTNYPSMLKKVRTMHDTKLVPVCNEHKKISTWIGKWLKLQILGELKQDISIIIFIAIIALILFISGNFK